MLNIWPQGFTDLEASKAKAQFAIPKHSLLLIQPSETLQKVNYLTRLYVDHLQGLRIPNIRPAL